MFKYLHVYIKVDCPFCKEAIDLLEEKGEEFVVTVMDKCEKFLDGIKQQVNQTTVPIIIECRLDGKTQLIGGFTELKSYLLKEKKERKSR